MDSPYEVKLWCMDCYALGVFKGLSFKACRNEVVKAGWKNAGAVVLCPRCRQKKPSAHPPRA